MNLLDVFLIVSGVIIFLFAFEIGRKQKFNALHFLVFFAIGFGLLLFTLNHDILQMVGALFGVQRGADVLVYVSIIFLFYFVLLLLRKNVDNSDNITSIIRTLAIESSDKRNIEGKVVFLIRAYNEGKVIKKVIESVLSAGYKNILIVNDGSTDNTLKVLSDFKGSISILNHSMNRGAGAALETGFEYLRRFGDIEYVVCFDADGQHDIGDIQNFFNEFNKDKSLEVLLGSRFIQKTNSNIPLGRRIILLLGRLFTFFLSNIHLTDAHNGYRVFRFSCLSKIFMNSDGMEYASELIEIIVQKNIIFKEVPVNIKYSDYSLSKGQKNMNALNIALRFIWNKFFR